jgi:hypothetical protein
MLSDKGKGTEIQDKNAVDKELIIRDRQLRITSEFLI